MRVEDVRRGGLQAALGCGGHFGEFLGEMGVFCSDVKLCAGSLIPLVHIYRVSGMNVPQRKK
jgi:hypothetical protein